MSLKKIFGSLKSKLSAPFQKQKPKLPNIHNVAYVEGAGHRGIAIGSSKRPDLSAGNVAKWRAFAPGTPEKFLLEGEPVFVHSTNVVSAQYFWQEEKMLVVFKNEGRYLYSNVTMREAQDFLNAQSKGIFIWDYFRIRGTKNGHKKPFVKLGIANTHINKEQSKQRQIQKLWEDLGAGGI